MSTDATRSATSPSISWHTEEDYWKQGRRNIIGIDEAGRGPLAGPVVAAAVMFGQECAADFPSALSALNDSKKLKESERERLFYEIQRHATAYHVGIVSNEEIDATNILRATMQAMTLAVEGIAREVLPDVLLVDGNYFRTRLEYPFQTIVGGDGISRSIAAASVLAKVTRDRMMRDYAKLYPEYNFAQHKGYGTAEHLQAIARFGLCPIHRRSFRKDKQVALFEQNETLTAK